MCSFFCLVRYNARLQSILYSGCKYNTYMSVCTHWRRSNTISNSQITGHTQKYNMMNMNIHIHNTNKEKNWSFHQGYDFFAMFSWNLIYSKRNGLKLSVFSFTRTRTYIITLNDFLWLLFVRLCYIFLFIRLKYILLLLQSALKTKNIFFGQRSRKKNNNLRIH